MRIHEPPDTSDPGAFLEYFRERMRRLQSAPGIGSHALGAPEDDAALWHFGGEYLASRVPPETDASTGPDVYLATQVYPEGGHTALIGDFVRALGTPEAHLVITDIAGLQESPPSEAILSRTGLAADRITILPGPSLGERLEQLVEKLFALRPARLLLFHHPGDPLASVVARPEIAPGRFLVHHADSIPSFGLHLPGVPVIDLNPVAAAVSRLQGLAPELLLLTGPDPGPRPHGFLEGDALVTATCGSPHKYTNDYLYGYAGTVAVILRATGGRHVHIGPLGKAMRKSIAEALQREELSEDRFVHVPRVDSLPEALWQYGCDLYFSSYPIDGARTNAEVAASGTPHLRHRKPPRRDLPEDDLGLRGALTWFTWNDLAETLQQIADPAALNEKSALMRQSYDALYHPDVFRRTLESILRGEGGVRDPHADLRDRLALQRMQESVATAVTELRENSLAGGGMDRSSLRELSEELAHQKQRIDFLQEKRRELHEKVQALQEKVAARPKPTRGLFRRH